MNVQKHKEKALRIERSLAKCVPGDYEIRIEAVMLAATHWTNLAFHAKRITPETQDVMHTYMLTINEYRRLSVADNRLIGLLAEIEDLRPLFVRGDVLGGLNSADRAATLLAEIRAIALIAEAGG
jgi:hypothetical protein